MKHQVCLVIANFYASNGTPGSNNWVHFEVSKYLGFWCYYTSLIFLRPWMTEDILTNAFGITTFITIC